MTQSSSLDDPHSAKHYGSVTKNLVEQTNWAATALGARSSWPATLNVAAQMVLHSRHPMLLFWGPELVQIYNDAMIPSMGDDKHPRSMGQRAKECWADAWPLVGAQIESVMREGRAYWMEDQLVPVLRDGVLQDVYWTYSYSPVFDEAGKVAGALVVCTETTSRVVGERRMKVLQRLSDATSAVIDAAQVYPAAISVMGEASSDLPFALLYSRATENCRATLAAMIGLDDEGATELDARLAREFLDRPARELRKGQYLSLDEGRTRLYISPVVGASKDGRGSGIAVLGVSTRLPFDAAYVAFMSHTIDQLSISFARIAAHRAQAVIDHERRDVLMQIPAAMGLFTGPDFLCELANPAYEAMLARPLVGKRLFDAFPELKGTHVDMLFQRVLASGERTSIQELAVPFRGSDGQLDERFFNVTLEALRSSEGAVYGVMAIAIDVSPAVRARQTMENAHAEREALLSELSSANRAKDEFLAMLGHELRNPLSPIVTALALMKTQRDGEASKEETIIERQVDHLVRLVDDLLDVSKITRGKVELKKEVVEISDVLNKAVEMASMLFEQRNHVLSISVARGGLRWHGDPVRLSQAVANLLTNAARYTPPGGKVELSAYADEDEIVIRVRDNGIGISAENLPHVFDMFMQAKRSTDRAEGGLGLGLTLVKTLVTMHGGVVEATSDGEGKGSEFCLRVPGATAEKVVRQVATPAPKNKERRTRRVLVVDDNEDAAELLGDAIRVGGHEVTVVNDPTVALAQWESVRPDVAILDIGLPVMDGYELAARLREQGATCRFIALTGYGRDHDFAQSRAAGFETHLVKPIDIEKLLKIVAR